MPPRKLKEKKNETPEQKRQRYVEIGYRIARGRNQNRDATEDDLRVQAIKYAETRIANEINKERMSFESRLKEVVKDTQDDEAFRESQMKAYHDAFEWNEANDEAALRHLIDLEIQVRQINRELSDPTKTTLDKDKLRGNLSALSREHRQLQVNLGIDKPAREKKSSSGTPMDDWNRIKEEASQKKQMQMEEFVKDIEKVKTEAELRDRMKYGVISLGGFKTIDAILAHHRRVLDLPMEIEKS